MSGRPFWNLEPCGTPAAYRRHYRKGQKPCERCTFAHEMAVAEYRRSLNAARRELYRQLREAGMSPRDATRGSRSAGVRNKREEMANAG